MAFSVYNNTTDMVVVVGADVSTLTLAQIRQEFKLLNEVNALVDQRRAELRKEGDTRSLQEKAQQKVDSLTEEQKDALRLALGMTL